MRVLVVHNRYRSGMPSGENRVVDREVDALRGLGLEVTTHLPSSDEIDGRTVVGRAALALGPVRPPGGVASLDRLLADAAPDVVHLHNVFPLVSPAIVLRAHRRGIPVVQTVHNHRHPCMSGWLYRDDRYCDDCLGRRLPLPGVRHGCYRGSRLQSTAMALGRARHRGTWQQVDHLLAISGFVRDRLIDDGFDPDRVSVKHNFVPDPGPVPEWSSRDHRLVFAARLAPEKGVDVVLEAWRAASLPDDWRLTVAGDGPLRPVVERAASRDPRIEVVGNRSAAEVSALLHRASVAVVASSAPDPGTLAVPEAFAHGTAVLAVAVGGVGELVGDAGILTTRSGLAAELRGLASRRDLADLARAGRGRFETTFSAEVVVPQLLSTYDAVTARSRPRGARR